MMQPDRREIAVVNLRETADRVLISLFEAKEPLSTVKLETLAVGRFGFSLNEARQIVHYGGDRWRKLGLGIVEVTAGRKARPLGVLRQKVLAVVEGQEFDLRQRAVIPATEISRVKGVNRWLNPELVTAQLAIPDTETLVGRQAAEIRKPKTEETPKSASTGRSLFGGMSNSEIAALVKQAQAEPENPEHFARIYDNYHSAVYRHLLARLNNQPEDAEDLTAQVFASMYKALGRYKDKGTPFGAWVFTIANNYLVTFYRANTRRLGQLNVDNPSVIAHPQLSIDDEDDLLLRAVDNETNQKLLVNAIKALTPDQQRVVIRRFFMNADYKDIAAEMGKKEGAIRVIQHRALLALKGVLDPAQF